MHRYLVYGLRLHSGFAIPELLPLGSDQQDGHDVTVATGAVAVEPPPDPALTTFVHVREGGRETRAVYEGVGRFAVHDGRQVVVDALPEADPRFVRHVLLGPVLAQLLWQRGLFTLHASVVKIGTHALAFMGVSGEGKSTTAAALEARGHLLVCDDIAAIPWRERPICALPGFPRIRLYPDSLRGIGEDPDQHPVVHSLIDKHLRPARGFSREPVQLEAIYVLRSGPELAISPLSRQAAMMELMRHSYNAAQLAPIVGFAAHMQMAATLAEQLPAYALERPRDLSRLLELVSYLERHVAS